jgi:phage-related protein
MGGNLLSVLLSIQGDASGAIGALSQVDARMTSLSGKTGGMNAGLTMVGAGMTAVGAMGANYLGDAVDKAAKYDSTLRMLNVALGDNAGSLGTLDAKAKELGANTVFGTQEALDTMLVLQRAGIDTDDILNDAAKGSMDLATATGESLQRSTEVVAQVMTTFHKDVSATGENTANTLTQVANASKSNVNDIGYSFSMVGAVAAGLNMSMEDTAKGIGVLSRAGLEGSDAGTSFKQMLLTLTPTTKTATTAMKKYGLVGFDTNKALDMLAKNGVKVAQNALGEFTVNGKGHFKDMDDAIQQSLYNVGGWTGSIEDADEKTFNKFSKWQQDAGLMGNAFFDASGHVKSMSEIAGVLNEKLAGATDQERIMAFKRMFGTDAVRAAQIFFDAGSEGFDGLTADMGKSATASEQASTQTQGAAGSMQRFDEAMTNLQLVIGGKLLPALTPLIDFLANLINGFSNLSPEVQGGIAIFGVLATVFLSVGGPILMLVGLFPLIASGFGIVAAAVGPILLPLGLIIGAIVGLKMAWDNNLLGMRDVITQFWTNTVQPFLNTAIQMFTIALPQALAALQAIWTTVWNAIVSFVQPILAGIFTELSKFWTEISPKLVEVWNFLSGTVFPIAMETIGGILNFGMTFITTLFSNTWNGIVTLLSGVWTMIQGIVQTVWAIVENIIKLGLAVVTGDWEGAWQAIQDLFKGVWDGITTFLQGAWTTLKGIIDTGLGILKTIWDTFWNWAGGFITTSWNNIVSFINTGITNAKNAIQGFIDGAKTTWETFWNNVGTFLSTTWNGIVETVKTKLGEIQTFISGLPKQLWDTLTSVGSSIISGIIEGLKGAAGAVWEWLKGMLGGMVDGVKNFFGIKSPSRLMAEQVGAPIAQGIGIGIGEGWGAIDAALLENSEGVVDKMAAVAEGAPGAAEKAIGGNDMANAVQPALDAVFEAYKKTFGRAEDGGLVETLLFGKPEGFFVRGDERIGAALDWQRDNVWKTGFDKLNEVILDSLHRTEREAVETAGRMGQGISEAIAAGILAGLPAIESAMGRVKGAIFPGGGNSGTGGTGGGGNNRLPGGQGRGPGILTGGMGGGGTYVINNNRAVYVDNTNTKTLATTQKRAAYNRA